MQEGQIRSMKQEMSGLQDGYGYFTETTYTYDHPEIAKYLRFFRRKFLKRKIFERLEAVAANIPPRVVAESVGPNWYAFSSFMPWFLSRAASKVTTNIKRHYVVQTLFEELGMRESNEIHPEMFKATALFTISEEAFENLSTLKAAADALTFLEEKIEAYQTDDEILGILLGLELPAEENIEAVFKSLAQRNPLFEIRLSTSHFFKLHRQIEVEHVRLTLSNFLRFCPTAESKERFVRGFEDGIEFWDRFWSCLSGSWCVK